MSAVKKLKAATSKADNLVFGLGITGMSVARYLKRNGIDALFVDSRSEPPGLDELHELLPDADVILGENATVQLSNINRIIASPGVADSEPMLTVARKAGIDVVSDIELFAQDAAAPIDVGQAQQQDRRQDILWFHLIHNRLLSLGRASLGQVSL